MVKRALGALKPLPAGIRHRQVLARERGGEDEALAPALEGVGPHEAHVRPGQLPHVVHAAQAEVPLAQVVLGHAAGGGVSLDGKDLEGGAALAGQGRAEGANAVAEGEHEGEAGPGLAGRLMQERCRVLLPLLALDQGVFQRIVSAVTSWDLGGL